MSCGTATRRLRAMVALSAFALVLVPGAARGSGTPPADYLAVQGLSRPVHTTVREVYRPQMDDGVQLYVEVTRPADAGPVPVIMEVSPYHGTTSDRDGWSLPDPWDADERIPMTQYFGTRGYAVAIVDLRGTGKSQGCLDHLGPKDAADMKTVVEWAASRPWSNGRVGMIGHSYVGSTPTLAAAQEPEGLVTIVPSAGLASMYHHQFQAGVPYFLQWAGPIAAYELLAIERHLPVGVFGDGENFGNDMEDFACGAPNSSARDGESQLSGAYSPWHEERDWREAATAADIPVFLVHGVNDTAVRPPSMDWFLERDNPEDKVWLGQWDHAINRRRGQWTGAIHAWFDHHLLQRTWTDAQGVEHPIDTGPPVEVFLSDAETLAGARTGDRDETLVASALPEPSTLELFPADGDAMSSSPPPDEAQAAFTGDPREGGNVVGFSGPGETGNVAFATEPVGEDVMFLGLPSLRIVASTTSPRMHLIATLYDETPDGARRRVTTFAMNPELREGLADPQPVVPGRVMELEPPGFLMAHHLRAGHRLVLRVTSSEPDKFAMFGADPRVTVYTGPDATRLRLPVVAEPNLHPDTVPFER